MKKRCKRVRKAATPPMLVSRGMVNSEVELRERATIEAFVGGWASKDHYDELADMRNVLTIAATVLNDKPALNVCDAMRIVMANIRERHSSTGRLGVNGEELAMLRLFGDFYREWWQKKSVGLYVAATDTLNRAHEIGAL